MLGGTCQTPLLRFAGETLLAGPNRPGCGFQAETGSCSREQCSGQGRPGSASFHGNRPQHGHPWGVASPPSPEHRRYKRALASSWACRTALLTHSSRGTQRDSSETTFWPNSLPYLVLMLRDPRLGIHFWGT